MLKLECAPFFLTALLTIYNREIIKKGRGRNLNNKYNLTHIVIINMYTFIQY